jgi:hypothetical protein
LIIDTAVTMRRIAQIILVLATSVATLFGVALGGNVLCFAADGHAAVEPPHPDGRHHDHDHDHEHDHEHDGEHDGEHEDSDGCPGDSGNAGGGGGGDCTDLSVDCDAVRDAPARLVDAPHVDVALPPPLAGVDFAAKLALLHRLPGPGTHPPAPGNLDRLRGIVLLV